MIRVSYSQFKIGAPAVVLAAFCEPRSCLIVIQQHLSVILTAGGPNGWLVNPALSALDLEAKTGFSEGISFSNGTRWEDGVLGFETHLCGTKVAARLQCSRLTFTGYCVVAVKWLLWNFSSMHYTLWDMDAIIMLCKGIGFVGVLVGIKSAPISPKRTQYTHSTGSVMPLLSILKSMPLMQSHCYCISLCDTDWNTYIKMLTCFM